MTSLASTLEAEMRALQSSVAAELTAIEQVLAQLSTTVRSVAKASSGGSGGTTISITDYIRTGSKALVGGVNTEVPYSSDLGVVPTKLSLRCYNATGDTVGVTITSITSTSFYANAMEDATIEWEVIKAI